MCVLQTGGKKNISGWNHLYRTLPPPLIFFFRVVPPPSPSPNAPPFNPTNFQPDEQRFKKAGSRKKMNLEVRAPLPKDFVRICEDLQLPLRTEDVRGGLYVDGEIVQGQELVELEGKWYG